MLDASANMVITYLNVCNRYCDHGKRSLD